VGPYKNKRGRRSQKEWSIPSKVSKTQHQNPEFGPKPGEIQKKKTLQTSTLAFKGRR
jgi:hypothetical protein